jgi:carboxyl-terminal processing protease
MKKKVLLAVTLAAVLMLLSGCMSLYGNAIESMFGVASDNSEQFTQTSGISSGADTVTVSKTDYDFYKNQYERLSKFSELADLYDIAEDYFYWEPDDSKMLEYAAKGLMAGLDDPYSFYYSSEEYDQLWADDEGNYVGIGVMIQSDTCTISRVFKGGPAEEAGVLRGDVLYRVGEDLYVTAETLSEAISIMRGEPDTFVDVTFLRDGEEITFTIQRREVVVNQIESTMLDDKVGYIAMYQFAGEAEKEFEEALNSVVSQGAESLIIDLRDNGGGWVEQARYIGDLFMDKGELCYLVYRDGTEDHLYRTYDGKTDILITILVNENTASSSEILTGALRDCANATVVGTKSFGKGIVQNVDTVGSNGAGYQITIAEYFTPKGNKVHKLGIEPDVVVELPEGDSGSYDFADLEHDVQLIKALEVARDKLK